MNAYAAPPAGRQVAVVLAAAGAMGFLLGMTWRPTWHDAIEPAQVLAGLVEYPADNPVYLYSTRTWTVLHQALAVLLGAGVSERTLSFLLSGTTGMLSFQALALIVLALSADTRLAVVAPAFILATNATFGGVTYPVFLLPELFSYGIVGLSYLLLAFGLIGAGCWRSGGVALGFAPAVHIALGGGGVAAAACVAMFRPAARRLVYPYLLAGLAAAGALAAIHAAQIGWRPSEGWTPDWSRTWEEHRQRFPLTSGRALGTYLGAAVPALWLWRFRRHLHEPANTLLALVVATVMVGALLSLSYWAEPSTVANAIAAFMPSRLLNAGVMSCMAVLIGLAARYRTSLHSQTVLAGVVAILVATAAVVRLHDVWGQHEQAIVAWLAMGIWTLALATTAGRLRSDGFPVRIPSPSRIERLRLATIAMMSLTLGGLAAQAAAGFPEAMRGMSDPAGDPVLAATAGRPGLLLTSSNLHLMQLATRRPVLLDGGALDGLMYVPAASAATDRILREVYGTSLAAVQATTRGALGPEAGKAAWEARTPAEWQRLAGEFGFTDIATFPGWSLQLPVVAGNRDLILYTVPR